MELLLRVAKWSILAGGATLLLMVLKGPLDRRYRAKWRYWLWLALAAALVLSLVPWGNLLPETVRAVEPPVVVQVPQTTIVVGRDGLSLAPEGEREGTPLTVEPAVGSSYAQEQIGQLRQETKSLPLDTVLTVLWLSGVAALLLRRLAGSWAFARKTRRWSRRASAETQGLCDNVREEMGIRGRVPLAVCSAVDSPMAVGLLRPRLLLPREDYGEQELDFILRHELTHIRRRDLWYKLLLLLAQAVHWFNPLVWLMIRQAEADIELTCDDAVMAGRDGGDRRAYSEALLKSLHRQKGLARAALSTHFYGGAEVMKARFRNILGSGKRRWGGMALTITLLLVAVVGCAVGVAATAAEPLSDEELAAWQEKLEDPVYNGFVAAMYSDVSRLPVAGVFYNGAGVDHEMTEAEREAVIEAMGGDPDCPIYAVTTQAADDFLRENTGLGLADIAGGFGSMWIYLPAYDSYYLAHGDTNYVGCTVTGGVRRGDTIELTIERPDDASGTTAGILTIVDGKIQSYTTPLYTAVETMAWQLMNDQAAEYESGEYGPTFVDRYISDLWCSASFGIDGTNYSVWSVSYRLLPEDLSKVVLAGGMDLENGWLTEAASMGSPVLIVSVDEGGNITLEEQTWAYSLWREDGFTWEEYIYCKIHMGMELTYKLGGWPELTTPFLMDLMDGHNTWALSWDSCAVAYLEERDVAPGPFTVVREFGQPSDSGCDKSRLIRCDSEDGVVYLFLCCIQNNLSGEEDFTSTSWEVCGEVWENGETQVAGRGEYTLYHTEVDFGGGRAGTLSLSGWQGNDCGGVSTVQVIWDNGGQTTFYTRDAIVAQWGADSRDYFTDASSYVETEDGYAFDGGLKLLDVNFDGYLDIGLQAWRDTDSGSWYEYFWLFDPTGARFQYAFCLRDVGTDPETGEVISAYTEDGIPHEDRYTWDEAGNLTLSRRLEGAADTDGSVAYSLINGVCSVLGYDAACLEWHLPSETEPEGWLYIASPYFLGDSFRGRTMEGLARWTDESREQLEVHLTENSPLNIGGTVDGPSRTFTVDLAAGKVLQTESHDYQGEEPTPLTEEELVRAAGMLAGIMGAAEIWSEGQSTPAGT